MFAVEQPEGVGISELLIKPVGPSDLIGLSGALGQNPEPDRRLVGTPVWGLPTAALCWTGERPITTSLTWPGYRRHADRARPHVKVHKSPELARAQVEAGAIGVTVATVPKARQRSTGESKTC